MLDGFRVDKGCWLLFGVETLRLKPLSGETTLSLRILGPESRLHPTNMAYSLGLRLFSVDG